MDMNRPSGQPTPPPVTPGGSEPAFAPATPPGSGNGDQHKALAIIGYIFPILFFIPLLTDAKTNPYARFHANQQLLLLLLGIAITVVNIIPLLGQLIFAIGWIVMIIFAIIGIINAAQGNMKPLPVIGKFTLIK